jgi:hypothetical protein
MSGFVAEAFSRKYGILIATAIFIIGVVVQITAISGGHEEILAGRFITLVMPNPKPAKFLLTICSGIGVGVSLLSFPCTTGECAPP